MAESKPIPVRLGDDVIQRLDHAAGRIGSNRAAVIRMLIARWLEDFEQGGTASLPPDWPQIMGAQDGRTVAAKMQAEAVPQRTPEQTAAMNDAADGSPATKVPPKPASYRGAKKPKNGK